ncbi:S1C family serine protease [Anaerobacillus alkaliphilus]|nr:trypsin-like peptidase domain-containing protein [Anaerobacillus alkaliphilus]
MNDFHYEETRQKRTSTSKNNLLVSFFSAVLGAAFVLALLPTLISVGFISFEDTIESMTSETTQTTIPELVPVSNTPSDLNSIFIEAIENVSPAIVGVVNIQQGRNMFSRDLQNQELGTGSGVVFEKKDGKAYIVTNSHVIEGATQVEVVLKDGNRMTAEVIGDDPHTDLAVIRIDDSYVTHVAEFGDSSELRVGEAVIAIGNPLGLQFSHSVTQGIISATERTIPLNNLWELTVLQTDAAINPGNSGGALINANGEVIGINSLKISYSGVEGLGFAIPSDDVLPIITQLKEKGKVARPFIGIETMDVSDVPEFYRQDWLGEAKGINEGVIINGIVPDSAAQAAGLKEGDIIAEINGNN